MKARQTSTKGPTKKEIRSKIQESVNNAIGKLHVGKPSRKLEKVVKKTSKLVAREVKQDLKSSKSKAGKASGKKKSKGQTSAPAS